jgi:hypothetical protein
MSCALYVGRARAPSPCHAVGPTQRRGSMKPSTKNQAKGKLHELKGKAKEVAGLAHPGPGPGSGGEGREDDGEGAGKGRRDRGGPRSVAGHAGPTYPVVSSAAIPGFHVALIPETDVVSHVASGTRMRWRIRGAARRLRTQAGRTRVSRWSHRWPHAAVLPHRAARAGGRRADWTVRDHGGSSGRCRCHSPDPRSRRLACSRSWRPGRVCSGRPPDQPVRLNISVTA